MGILSTLIIGAVGASIDTANAFNQRANIQRAADTAVLAGAANPEMSISTIRELARSNLNNTALAGNPTIDVVRSDGQVSVTIDATVPTFLMGIVGFDGLSVNASSAGVFVPGNGGKIEVALVLDTTESMADDMPELRASALELVNTLYAAAGENVKISVVPYAAAVNIGNGPTQLTWMDTAGTAPYHAIAMEEWKVTNCNGDTGSGSSCWQGCGCPGKPACGGGDDGASLSVGGATKYAGSLLNRLLGTTVAEAGGANPYPEPDPAVCPMSNPEQINHFDLFDLIPNSDWMGCVEARPPLASDGSALNYDVRDIAPNPMDPATLFVPYFWMDDPDWFGDDASITWSNDYIHDTNAGPFFDTSVQYIPSWIGRHRNNIWKFDGTEPATIVENDPDMSGPNRACPDPLAPLTADRTTVEAKVNSLTHREGGGTVISEGLMWGWRTLSPGAPFSEGAEYDDGQTKKIIVLMSDGANQIIARNDAAGVSMDEAMGDYSAYGFAREFDAGWARRELIDSSTELNTPYFDQIRNYLDERTLTACSNIKAAGEDDNPIEIYTLLVGDSDPSTVSLMETCATTVDKHYKHVSEIEVLSTAFRGVAEGIIAGGSSRLVR